MKQFTFSAQVANNLLTVLQGYSKTIRLLLVILTMFVLSIGQMYGYTITFNGSASESTSLSTSTTAASITGNSTYVTGNLVTATKVYGATSNGVKLGTSSNAGTIKFNLSTTGQVTPTSIVVNCKLYNSSKSATLKVNGSATQNVPSSSGNLTFAITSPITYIELVSNKYIWIKSVTVNTAAGYKVTYDKNGATSGSVPTDATSYNSGATVTVKSNSGNLAKTGYTFGGWNTKSDGTGTNYTAGSGTFTITANTTLYAKWNTATKYTVTLDAGSGTCAASVTEASAGAGVTLPAPTLDGCGDWEFAGWKTTSAVTTETTTEPTLIPAGAYSPTSDITLYAVYQRTETTSGGGGGGVATGTISFVNTTQRDSRTDEQQVWSNEDIIFTNNKSSSTTNVADYSNPARFYANSQIIISAPGAITQIVADCDESKYATALSNSIEDENTVSGVNITITPSESSNTYTIVSLSAQTRLNSLTVTYTSGGGSSSTTYYHSTPDCGVASTPTLTVDKTSLAFGNVATDSNKEMDFTLTGSNLTANATLALSGTNESMFSVNPPSVTQSEGTIDPQNITVTYTPTAAGEHTATLTISSTGAESKTVALSGTGVAPAAKYTVTFNAGSGTCDDESLTETSGGAGVTLPTANPPAACATDGWEFAGWWTESVAGTTTSPGELLTAGSNYKPASDCTLYAVYSYTEAGGGDSNVTFNFSNIASANSWSNGIAYTTVTISPITINAIGGGNNGKYYTSNTSWRMYNGGSLQISTDIGKITSVSSNPSKTFTINDEGTATLSFSATTEFKSITVSYSSTTTTYNSNPVCVASWSITYDFADGTGSHCSNTSVPQDNPTYTICEEEPTKEGYTFQGWSDGTSIYAAGATITLTKNTTLTAQWQIKTYTVIWSVNGDTTTEDSYEHGQTLNVPDPEDIPSCDGVKEFVGWTEDNTFTYHATTPPSDLFTEKTATVTADKTYYAVFATPPGTGGGGGGSETTTTLDFTAQGYSNGDAISNLKVSGVTAAFDKGSNSNAPTYYDSGSAIRAYGGNTITLSANQITAATFTFGSSDGSNVITADCGSWESPTWTGDATDEVVFTISGSSGNRRIKSIAVTYISGGGSGSYSDYTTICQQIESIEVQSPQTEFYLTNDFTIGSGKVIATLSGGGTTDVTALATFSGYNMEVVGTYTVTVTYMGATATYNINVKPLDNAWVLTWNVSGKTNMGLGPRYVTKGDSIGTLPTPEVPAACAGKTFMGWTESNVVNSDGSGITYITKDTKPTDNTTYYAVFATVNNFCTQKPIDQIASGSKVVIVAVASLDAGGTTGKAISSRTSDDGNNLAGDEVSIYDKTINTPHSTCIWTLYKDGEQYYFKQGDYFLNAVDEEGYTNLKWNETKELWNITSVPTYLNTYYMESTHVPDTYIEWYIKRLCFKTYYDIANENGEFDMQFFVTANANGGADITDYTTGCEEYTITYYGFHGGYSTSCSSDGTIVLPVNSIHTIPDCEGLVINDHTNLGREFLNVWMTQPHGGHTFKPGDTFILTQDTTLYAQWKMETTSDVTTLPTDIEDLAGTDIYVYGGTTLNIQPGTTTINSLTLKGGLQADGSYKMPTVWVPEGATLVRNSNKINLDLIVNAKTYYPFAVPFAAKNNQYVEYLDPVLAAASTYGTHFAIKTYDGARRADVGEDKANNWVRVLRDSTLQPGVGYIITALTYPDKDTATIRIPMTVPNTWFKNGEQAAVNTTVRNTIAVTAHAGEAATEHQRHAGWNFVANPYLTSFAGGNVANDGGLDYINGELIIQGSYEYTDEEVPYVTVPAYDFAYYSQYKLSDVKLSPEWSFFVQVGTGGTMNFTTAGRQQAPASIAARNAEERPVKMDVDLILSDNHSSDQTGIIISDRYTDAYEIGRDLEKLFGSAYNLSVYTLMEDNTPLAFQALAIRSSMQVIPVGYRAPEQGEYTFRLNEATSSIDLLNEQYEQLVLVDYQTGELTNLLYTDYTFYSERTQSNSRFAIYAVPRQNAPTDLPNAIGSDEEVRKVIYNDHLYILRDGNVYNGMGQKM